MTTVFCVPVKACIFFGGGGYFFLFFRSLKRTKMVIESPWILPLKVCMNPVLWHMSMWSLTCAQILTLFLHKGGSGTSKSAQELTRRDRKTVPHPAPPGDWTQGLRIWIPMLWPLSYAPPPSPPSPFSWMVFSFVFLLAPDMTPNYVSNRQLENPSTCGRHKAVCAWPMCGADREPGGLRGDRVNAETELTPSPLTVQRDHWNTLFMQEVVLVTNSAVSLPFCRSITNAIKYFTMALFIKTLSRDILCLRHGYLSVFRRVWS